MHLDPAAAQGRTRTADGARTRSRPGLAARDLPDWHRSGLLFSAGLVLLLIAAVAYLLNPNTLPIRYVHVNGEFRHLSTAALQVRGEDVVRGGFFDVNVEAIRKALLQEPWVREVTVRRIWPDGLGLQVQEQVAVALWGADRLLNEQGQLFEPAADTLPPDLPVLEGPDGTHVEVLTRFRSLQRALAEHDMRIAKLALSERRSWSFTLVDGPTVDIGRRDFAARVDRFISVVPAFLAGDLNRIAVIDMRYTNGFAVRRNTSGAGVTSASPDNHGQTQS